MNRANFVHRQSGKLVVCVALLAAMTMASVASVNLKTGPADDDWPSWRGPASDGTSRTATVPTVWSRTENVIWQAAVPGRGHASPIVCKDRVFITTADEQAQRQLVLAFDRRTGRQIWSTTAHEGGFMTKHGKNSHA